MSDFSFQIVGDASKADQAIGKVTSGLDGIQKKAGEASEGLSKATDLLGKLGGSSALLSGIGGGIGGLAAGAFDSAIEGIKETINYSKEMKERLREMHDEYLNTANAALKFVDSSHSVNQVIAEQQALAHGLHASLHETMDLYDAVRDGTDDLNLSHGEQIRLTKSLGEAVQLSGRSLGEAGGVMAKLSYAMSAGTISGGELRSMMRQLPELGDLWTKSLGMSRKELVELANKGLLDVNRLINPLIDNVGELDQKFGKQTRTTAQWREELKTAFDLAKGQGKGSVEAITEAFEKTADPMIDMATRQKAAIDLSTNGFERATFQQAAFATQGMKAAETTKTFRDIIDDTTSKLGRIEGQFERSRAAAKAWEDALRQPTGVQSLFDQLAGAGTQGFAAFEQLTKFSRERSAAVTSAKADLASLEAAYKAGAIPVSEYTEKHRQLIDVINGTKTATNGLAKEVDDYAKLVEQLNAPEKEAIERYNLLGQAYMNGAISARVFAEEQEKVRNQLIDMGKIEIPSVTTPLGAPEDPTKGIDTGKLLAQAQQVDYLTDAWKREIAANQKAAEEGQKLGQAFSPLKDALVDVFKGGELSGEKFLGILQDISIKLLEMAAIKAIQSNIGGGAGGFLTGLLGGKNGFDYTVDRSGFQLPGFATGGGFTVGGSGGTDSQLIAFRATPGESVHVRTPAQRDAEMAAMGPRPQVHVTPVFNMQSDPREISAAMGSYSGQREIVKLNRKFNRRR